MKRQEVIRKVKSLNLPEGEYVVTSGAVLAAHGIRDCGDIDIAATGRVLESLKNKGWEAKDSKGEGVVVSKGDIEVGEPLQFLHVEGYNPSLEDLVSRSDLIDGVPFASLEDTVAFKRALGREKDKEDIRLIQSYLES